MHLQMSTDVWELTWASDHDPSRVFHRKVNKRALPEYYEVIKEPMALSTVKVSFTGPAGAMRGMLMRDARARQISTIESTRSFPTLSGISRW